MSLVMKKKFKKKMLTLISITVMRLGFKGNTQIVLENLTDLKTSFCGIPEQQVYRIFYIFKRILCV